jgi:hypothetical protein
MRTPEAPAVRAAALAGCAACSPLRAAVAEVGAAGSLDTCSLLSKAGVAAAGKAPMPLGPLCPLEDEPLLDSAIEMALAQEVSSSLPAASPCMRTGTALLGRGQGCRAAMGLL